MILKYVLIGVIITFGVLISLTIQAVIAYDLLALHYGWRTISEEVLRLGEARLFWAVLVTAELTLPVGLLLGHLLLAQHGPVGPP